MDWSENAIGYYLPTGNHPGCNVIHIPKRRCVLRQAVPLSGLYAAQSGNRAARLPQEVMVCACIVMKCEGFSQITDLADYRNNSRLIAHSCGFDSRKPLPSYWTYDRFIKKLDNGEVKKLYELGIVNASFIGLDSTPGAANTKQTNPTSFAREKPGEPSQS